MKNKSSLSPEQQSLVASILGEHLNEVSFSHVEVPTKCKWYTTDSIGIRPFTFEDEKYVLRDKVIIREEYEKIGRPYSYGCYRFTKKNNGIIV